MKLYTVLLAALTFYTTAIHASTTASTSTISSSKTINNTEGPISGNDNNIFEDDNPFQPSLDAISLEWKQICDMGCQPGTWPSDSRYISEYVVPELISIQYKPTCSAKLAHQTYLREIFECSGRRDLCLDMDKNTMKCRDKAMRKVTSALKHLGENGMDCGKDGAWQEEFYESVLEFMRYFRSSVCRGVAGGEMMRDCKLMGNCVSLIQDS
ncbi:hypothetical protein UA08_02281 [Talaromyces atroroseus]|uniref:Uncharacterized protein n=1 Tax=Talaromyces atroroseus TaxID=1441469 RepID=A0A225B2W6_TALAT|nr:hypothetical protein UA08_02281 [Talaromyces atroroseus]OKL62329.1 hypothetical protein UA08_02281 [Talaromyces atroroseus]